MSAITEIGSKPTTATRRKRRGLWQQIVSAKYLFLMFLPGFALILVFNYGPMYGLQLAFKHFRFLDGVWGSPWVGLEHFRRFFTSQVVLRVLRNTIEISLLRILIGFPAPIILAICINELRDSLFKRVVQTASYLPHFISWVAISALFYQMLSPSLGPVNWAIKALGMKPIYFMTDKAWFRPALIISDVWKGVGWGAILYLAIGRKPAATVAGPTSAGSPRTCPDGPCPSSTVVDRRRRSSSAVRRPEWGRGCDGSPRPRGAGGCRSARVTRR